MPPNPSFTILCVDLATGRVRREAFSGSALCLGGSGLAAALFAERDPSGAPPQSPERPVIFAIGPLTGLYPAMSKTVCGFVSPHSGQYAESHAGGGLALALRRSGVDALVLTGRAPGAHVLTVGRDGARLSPAGHLLGLTSEAVHDAVRAGRPRAGGRLSVAVTGPAADTGCTYACVTVDRYRHFGRLGLGAALSARGLKALAVLGDGPLPVPPGPQHTALVRDLTRLAAQSPALEKYRGPGTAQLLGQMNALSALPWRNLQATTDPRGEAISGERIPYALPVRKAACAGCPIGCIHLGALHEPGHPAPRLVGYDYEHMACCGSMLGLTEPRRVLELLSAVEAQGVDVISAGVALSWATEAMERGLVTEQDAGLRLRFGDAAGYVRAVELLGAGGNEFWRAMARGARHAASVYGGEDYALVLGQEMSGYACGPVFFAAQALNFRHSHLDNACYAFDLEHPQATPEAAARFLLEDEVARVGINCMVACLFARHIYPPETLAECLAAAGHEQAAADFPALCEAVRRERWRRKFATGFDPDKVRIPKRYTEIATARGPVREQAVEAVRAAYAAAIRALLR